MANNVDEKRFFSIKITGTVQGVGFRPFVFRLAAEAGTTGTIRNDSKGVTIIIYGYRDEVERLEKAIIEQAPPAASISKSVLKELNDTDVHLSWLKTSAPGSFHIQQSRSEGSPSAVIPPDLYLCKDCLKELLDSNDRRFHYPFINCTNCGPRYSIIEALPYDRPNTSMKGFPMCQQCRKEYEDPMDRRFHAQPVACPACGPSIKLLDPEGTEIPGPPIEVLVKAFNQGKIAAIKGLGGFHLAADATNHQAVKLLRKRKRRRFKPFAIMARDIQAARRCCDRIGPDAEKALLSARAPIVLLPKGTGYPLSPAVAPNIDSIGIMLPYTPIHHLLFQQPGSPDYLIMTSANISNEPICNGNQEALERLANIADLFLVHNRPIVTRLDDSVTMATDIGLNIIRRARGMVPAPVRTGLSHPDILALGADLKTTICLARDGEFVLSQHLGDASHTATLEFMEETRQHLCSLLEMNPKIIACDLHPDFFTSRIAQELSRKEGIPLVPVQHHKAHVAQVAAEHNLNSPLLACILDGTGWGDDSTIWGGEFFMGSNPADLKRIVRFDHLHLPGGDKAAREPWRMGLAALHATLGRDFIQHPLCKRVLSACNNLEQGKIVATMLEKGINAPMSSSCGRLFDAAAALLGICYLNEHEAQAAMELETAATGFCTGHEDPLQMLKKEGLTLPLTVPVNSDIGPLSDTPSLIPTRTLLTWLISQIERGVDRKLLAISFHLWLIEELTQRIRAISELTKIDRIILSGGCFMNRILFTGIAKGLQKAGLKPLWGAETPMNDGGISLGQAYTVALIHHKGIKD